MQATRQRVAMSFARAMAVLCVLSAAGATSQGRSPDGILRLASVPGAPKSSLPAPALVQTGETPLSWKPQLNKYLLLFCGFGRMSNQVACVKKTLRLAVLLNRTLLVPPRSYLMFQGTLQEEWNTDMLFDVRRMVECLRPAYGTNTVVTFEEYFRRHKVDTVVVNRIRCAAVGPVSNCAHPSLVQALLHAVGPTLRLPPLADYPKWLDASPLPVGRPVRDSEVVELFRSNEDHVLCVGELFGMLYDPRDSRANVLARPKRCNNLWRPHPQISRFVDGVLQKMLKTPKFAAVHLRRGDFYQESVIARKRHLISSGYFSYSPITEVAKAMAARLREARIKTVYVATDASKFELKLFKNVLREFSSVGRILTLRDVQEDNPGWLAKQPWAQGAIQLANSSATGIPWILTDKGIASRASLFLGTKFSTFSSDIVDMRCDERRTHGWDISSVICYTGACTPASCQQL